MLSFHFKLSAAQRMELNGELERARGGGDGARVNRVLSILALDEGVAVSEVARMLRVSQEAVRGWLKRYLLRGARGLQSKNSPGRPPKLTKAQRRKLCQLIDEGPAKAGLTGNCWRSPMIQHLIQEHFGVFYCVHYLSALLRSMGYSYQKARFVSEHLDPQTREQWLSRTWPQILKLARRKNAYLLFGDEASFPQWGTLTDPWARKGQQPTVQTCGRRKGYKVFGLIDSFTGRLFYQCQEERLTSHTYAGYLKEVLAKTRKHIVLIQDGAKYHTSAAMRAFFQQHQDRLTVFPLPCYSPDYNPIEKLWKKVKEKGTHLQYFPTFEALKDKVHETLSLFQNAPQEVLSLFGLYHRATA
jgi:transposase